MAILIADVAGYSRLIGIDDEGTLAQLNAHHAELIEPKIIDAPEHFFVPPITVGIAAVPKCSALCHERSFDGSGLASW
jgi:hypothetical protein